MKTHTIYLLAIVLILIAFGIREGCNQRDADKLISDISEYKTEATTYKTKLGLEISTNKALALETQSQMKSMLAANNDTIKQWLKKFKEIKSGVVIKEETIIREVPVPFDKVIPCDFKPFKVNKITDHFKFYTTVSNTGFVIDSLKIPNTATVVIGERKDGLFKKKKLVVDVNNSNPYIVTTNISGNVYDPEKKWYQRTWFKVTSGAVGGFVVYKAGKNYINNQINK